MAIELSNGTSLLHYRIISKIGAGGMGDVYFAEDRKLDRNVALKVLPAEIDTAPFFQRPKTLAL